MVLPTMDKIESLCPVCGDVTLEQVSNENTPDMNHAFKGVNLQKCPKCGVEVTITTTIDIEKPEHPQMKGGFYLPKDYKREL